MKVPTAIEILQLNVDEAGKKMPQDTLKALKLGIEALKAIYAQYDPDHQMMRRPLPGETPEETPETSFRHTTADHRQKAGGK